MSLSSFESCPFHYSYSAKLEEIQGAASIRRVLIAVAGGNFRSRVRDGGEAVGRFEEDLGGGGVAVHEAAVDERVVVRNVLLSGQAVVPGISPLDRPFRHQPGAGGMHDRRQLDVVHVIA